MNIFTPKTEWFNTFASTMSNDASILCIFCSNSTNFVSHLVINSLRNETVDMINSLINAAIRFCSMGGTLNMPKKSQNGMNTHERPRRLRENT